MFIFVLDITSRDLRVALSFEDCRRCLASELSLQEWPSYHKSFTSRRSSFPFDQERVRLIDIDSKLVVHKESRRFLKEGEVFNDGKINSTGGAAAKSNWEVRNQLSKMDEIKKLKAESIVMIAIPQCVVDIQIEEKNCIGVELN
ncbi:hypothetical protein CEXT_512831 [Caerostris extrusa]|uniref:Uncharacterized protein n=1 Tax=Caerostris extrusa TaxID=172846 RepID=A0AAV4XF39_CAEEX|nr:hypothetical protein CEXT_512831 [Caerostris extrusa]